MKFNILKLIILIAILSLFIKITYSSQTQSQIQSTSKSQTEVKTLAGSKANYKITLGSLASKANRKKVETNFNSQVRNSNENSELGRLSIAAPQQTAENQIFFKGWVKYFKFTDSFNSKKPKQFFMNVMFEKEAKRKNMHDKENVNLIYGLFNKE